MALDCQVPCHGIYTVSTRYPHGIYTVATRYLHGIYTVSTDKIGLSYHSKITNIQILRIFMI